MNVATEYCYSQFICKMKRFAICLKDSSIFTHDLDESLKKDILAKLKEL